MSDIFRFDTEEQTLTKEKIKLKNLLNIELLY